MEAQPNPKILTDPILVAGACNEKYASRKFNLVLTSLHCYFLSLCCGTHWLGKSSKQEISKYFNLPHCSILSQSPFSDFAKKILKMTSAIV